MSDGPPPYRDLTLADVEDATTKELIALRNRIIEESPDKAGWASARKQAMFLVTSELAVRACIATFSDLSNPHS